MSRVCAPVVANMSSVGGVVRPRFPATWETLGLAGAEEELQTPWDPLFGGGRLSYLGALMPPTSSDLYQQERHVLDSRGKVVLTLLLGAQFLIALDFSILNVALPTIGADLRFAFDDLQWVATAFALAATSFTLFFGRVGDIVGRRHLFMTGMALLAIASAVGASAQTPTVLLVARVAQGLATAMVVPSGLALLTTSFPEGPLRSKALGLNGALLSAGFTAGAVLGGVLAALSWRWALLINIPVCALILVLAPMFIADSRPARRPRLDVPGTLTITGGLLALVYSVTSAGQHGWSDPRAVWPVVAAVVLIAAFWVVERRSPEPLVAVDVLRRPTVLWGNIGGLVTFTMFTAQVFLLTLYLQRVLGFTPTQTGLVFGVLGATAFLAGVIAPRMLALLGGSRRTLVISLVAQAAATGVLALLGDSGGWLWLVLGATAVGGFVHCLAVVSFMVTGTSGLPDDVQGLATGLASMTQQVGITLGIPILSAVATARIGTDANGAIAGGPAVLDGVTFALGADAIVVLIGAALIAVFLRPVATAVRSRAGA